MRLIDSPDFREGVKIGYDNARKEFERPQGEWASIGDEPKKYHTFEGRCYKCSLCGFVMLGNLSYCPECGARMSNGVSLIIHRGELI